ncbi:MAG: beta-N-acetylhexosaminidase [Vicinamibacteria bacterium]|nr:beta-N-acetylhexosaminidase [Vicinamibacteria bacterium]
MSPVHLRHQIGQLLMAGFPGTSLTVELRALAREFSLGGVVYFARNVEEPAQVAEVSREIATLTDELPPWVSVDQEGGRVARFKRGFTLWPPMSTLGRSGDVELARQFARALTVELRAVGITLDFAPVLDVFTNPKNTVIGDRALAQRAEDVATLGVAIIEELQRGGIAACGKHFPGHGDTLADSHHDLPLVEHEPDRLRAVEFVPFRAAIAAGVASLMSCHVLLPAFDETRPGTLSPDIVQGLLRDELGFDGLIFTDDMEMKAIAARMPVPDACVAAIAAGCDAVLVCSGNHDLQAATIEALIRAVERGELPYARVEQALAHQRRAKQRFLVSAPSPTVSLTDLLATEAHQAVADQMARFAWVRRCGVRRRCARAT